MSFLEQVVQQKRREVDDSRRRRPLVDLERRCAASAAMTRVFVPVLRGPDRIIAEIKRRSPSVASFRQQGAVERLARIYAEAGAAAISVVTDSANFGTSLADAARVRAAVALPVLVKDFIIDPHQVFEARLAGADALLLIARILSPGRLTELHRLVMDLGMTALVECHDAAEVESALAAGASVVGINNRDLGSLDVSLETARELARLVSEPALCVAESGIKERGDVEALAAAGADAFLVGGALLGSADPGSKLRELRGALPETGATTAAAATGAASPQPTRVKICGLTSPEEARACRLLGADYLGVIFAPSARRVTTDQARAIRRAVPDAKLVGIFADAAEEDVAAMASAVGLDLIQLHGAESDATCARLRERLGVPVIKAIAVNGATDVVPPERTAADLLLLDLPKDLPADAAARATVWDHAARARAAGHQVLLAGALEPENVAAAVRHARPHAVDVCRGVESAPGVKNLDRVERFIREVRNA